MSITNDIKVLNHLLALNLDITLWTARRKLSPEDFGGVELPPEDLASLGSKRICDPAKLCVFTTLKARATSLLARNGIRFLGGWAIPEDKAESILQELCRIRDDFRREKNAFLANYDQAISEWIDRHPAWASIIAQSTVSAEYVAHRMDFAWQLYRVAPASEIPADCGLHEEAQGLAATLFKEVSQDADQIWRRVYAGKEEVTHKALSPLRTMRDKLLGLTFMEPHVAPVANLIQTALDSMPKRGNLRGSHLVMLQGLVNLLRQPDALVLHAQTLLEAPHDLGDSLQHLLQTPAITFQPAELAANNVIPVLDSFGLW